MMITYQLRQLNLRPKILPAPFSRGTDYASLLRGYVGRQRCRGLYVPGSAGGGAGQEVDVVGEIELRFIALQAVGGHVVRPGRHLGSRERP